MIHEFNSFKALEDGEPTPYYMKNTSKFHIMSYLLVKLMKDIKQD